MTELKLKKALYTAASTTFVFTANISVALAAGGASHNAKAATEHHSDAGGLPQLDFSTYASQIFWLLIFFSILYIFFAKKTLPNISSVIENRKEHIQGDLNTAQRLKDEAEEVHQAYQAALDKARKEAHKLFKTSDDEIKAKAESEQKAFYERSHQEIEATEKRIEDAKAAAMEDMNAIAAEVASEAAQKIVGISADINEAKTVVRSIHKKKAA